MAVNRFRLVAAFAAIYIFFDRHAPVFLLHWQAFARHCQGSKGHCQGIEPH